jgi:hypothetical protein
MAISERHGKTSHAGGVLLPGQKNGALREFFSSRPEVAIHPSFVRSHDQDLFSRDYDPI